MKILGETNCLMTLDAQGGNPFNEVSGRTMALAQVQYYIVTNIGDRYIMSFTTAIAQVVLLLYAKAVHEEETTVDKMLDKKGRISETWRRFSKETTEIAVKWRSFSDAITVVHLANEQGYLRTTSNDIDRFVRIRNKKKIVLLLHHCLIYRFYQSVIDNGFLYEDIAGSSDEDPVQEKTKEGRSGRTECLLFVGGSDEEKSVQSGSVYHPSDDEDSEDDSVSGDEGESITSREDQREKPPTFVDIGEMKNIVNVVSQLSQSKSKSDIVHLVTSVIAFFTSISLYSQRYFCIYIDIAVCTSIFFYIECFFYFS
jgi:hypothetical protein